MTPGASESPKCSPEAGCITCGDVAAELDVVLVDGERGLALCRDRDDRRESVEIALVGPVAVGDRLLVHAGTAIAHLGVGVDPAAVSGRESRRWRDEIR